MKRYTHWYDYELIQDLIGEVFPDIDDDVLEERYMDITDCKLITYNYFLTGKLE